MSGTHIPKSLREKVSMQARYRCGYCLTSAAVVGTPMELDHIIPESLGGLTVEENLWLACSLCNSHKADRIGVFDAVTGETVRLFDPRHQIWSVHFRWTPAGDEIVGITPCGRASVVALNLNRPSLVHARRAWVLVGWHPPKD
jgi:hypothetical protein